MAATIAATQAAPNPNVLRRGTLGELAQRLERLKATTKDVVADTREVGINGLGQMMVPNLGALPLTRYAHTQLAEKVGIPQKYYDRLLGANAELYARNVNHWLQAEPERRLFRAADGHVRAILSDKYRSIDNYDVALLAADRATEQGAEVLECSLSETRMYLKLTVPKHREVLGKLTEAQIAEARRRGLMGIDGTNTHAARPAFDADYVVPGLIVSNSEVGAGAFRVEPFAYRLICYNLAVSEQALHQVHLGTRLEVGEIAWSEVTRKLDDAALTSKVKDAIDTTFNVDSFRAMVARMTTAKEVVIEKPIDVTDGVALKLGLSEERKQSLLRYFTIEGHTAFGMGQAVARLAQDLDDADAQVEFERQAGNFLAKPDEVLAFA